MTRPTAPTLMTWGLAAALLAAAAGPAAAQRMIPNQPAGPGGTVSLPYMVADNTGNQWRVFQSGYLQQSGNMPLYSQGAMLNVNGNMPQQPNRMARLDPKTGELLLEGMTTGAAGVTVTSRVLVDKETNVVRYIDVFKNTGGQEQNLAVTLSSNMNYGINTALTVPDPKRKDQPFAWVAQTSGNGAVMEMYAGKNAKAAMTINHQQGNNQVTANFQTKLPPGKEIALMHLHGVQPSQDAAAQFVLKLKESELLKRVPPDVRKLIVNFAGGSNFIGDVEVLRGDLLDVVELRGGDQLKGTLKQESYELTTFYGPVTLAVDKVIALLNVGAFRPRQLVVTTDGQIFGGALKQDTLELQLSSGQVTKIPLAQVTRMGYRKRAGEPEEWTFEKPIVLMRSGERVAVQMPATPFEVATRYGKLTLKPEQVAAVLLQSEDAGVHRVTLTDGSSFSGLLAADVLEMKLDTGGGPEQVVKFPVSAVARFQLTPKVAEPDDLTATVKLANDDLLVGAIGGQLKVDTAFDTLTLNAAEVRELKHPPGGGVDVQVVLFDGSSVSGQLQELDLPVDLAGGVKMRVPLALLEEYVQPQPTPSKEMQEKIQGLIKELAAEDWKARDRAQAGLVNIGPAAIAALKKMRDGQSPEAQQRIDSILKELDKQREKPAGTKPGGAGGPQGRAGGAEGQNVIVGQDVEERQFPLLNTRVGG